MEPRTGRILIPTLHEISVKSLRNDSRGTLVGLIRWQGDN